MAYTKINFVNDNPPAISAENLNHMEQGIYDAHEQAATLDEKVNDRYTKEETDVRIEAADIREGNLFVIKGTVDLPAALPQGAVADVSLFPISTLISEFPEIFPEGSTWADWEVISVRQTSTVHPQLTMNSASRAYNDDGDIYVAPGVTGLDYTGYLHISLFKESAVQAVPFRIVLMKVSDLPTYEFEPES